MRSVYYICGELIGEDRYTMRLVKDNELEGVCTSSLSTLYANMQVSRHQEAIQEHYWHACIQRFTI